MASSPLIGRRSAETAHAARLTRHLAVRELTAMHRLTVLGWLWPLVKQLAQVGVLVFAFSVVLDLGIPDYGVFVFSGLLAWSWFSDGVSRASWSVIQGGHLLRHPKFPAHVLPFTAVSVPLIDVLIGLPVLLVALCRAAAQGSEEEPPLSRDARPRTRRFFRRTAAASAELLAPIERPPEKFPRP